MRANLYTNQQSKTPEYFHSISTDNEKFINLGLDVFTTGTLYDWLCTKSSGPKRVNFEQIKEEASESDAEAADFYRQRLSGYDHLRFYVNEFSSMFNGGSSNGSLPTEVVLTPSANERDESCSRNAMPFTASFYAWRNDGRNGEYILVKNTANGPDMNWKFSEGSESYVWNDLRIDEFDGIHYDKNSIELTSPDVFPVVPEDGHKLIRNIIEMNRYVNLLSRVSYKDWKSKDKARHRFINDIRSSKYGCLEWKSNITFLLDLPQVLFKEGINTAGEDCDNCAKEVTVTFKLDLFGNQTGRRTGTSVASVDTTIIQTKTTPYGSPYVDKDETGSLPPSAKPNPNNGTAGELSNHFVPLEGKFESGTTQVFAIMTEDLPGSQQPSLDDALAEDSPFLLNKSTGFEVNVGKAMIVSMQNANPKQWMPDFAKPRNCRDGNNDKVIVNVYNPTSRGFVAGENVILQKLDGVFVPLSVGEGSSAIAAADPNWEFMYLMTNSMFFFRNHDWVRKQAERGNTPLDNFDVIGGKDQTLSTPDNYEQSFYYWYYKIAEETERQINPATANNVPIIDTPDNRDRYGDSVAGYARVFNGYMQVTSWDFMGIGVGGTRRQVDTGGTPGAAGSAPNMDYLFSEQEAIDENFHESTFLSLNGNAISTTQFSQDTAGNAFENGGLAGKLNSYPFFGCVFPQGYNGQSKYAELMADDTDFFLAPKNYVPSNESAANYRANGPFFYASNGKPFQNINNVQNLIGNQANDQTKGMFPDSEAGALKHLPADIGTNSAPGGINGRPISNIGMIGDLNTLLQETDFRRHVNKYFQTDAVTGQPNRYSWMHKKDREQVDVPKTSENAQNFAYDYSDSVFDLEPVNALKIEFRPLSNELYACFEGYNFIGNGVSLSPSYVYGKTGDDRGELSTRIYQTNKAFSSPLSPLSLYRNTQVTNIPNMLGVTTAGADGTNNITRNLTLFQNGGKTVYGSFDGNANGFRYGPDLDSLTLGGPFGHRPQGPSASPQLWFQDNWWGGDFSPSAALGVIGAVVTVATANTLQFITENAVGLDDYLQTGDYFPSYVGGDFSKLNTSQLYARVYQQWPRDQMIYDPRFFVVHHFNDGIDIARNGVNYEWYVNGSPIEGEPLSEQISEGYPLGAYKVDKSESSVDFRVPTDWNNNTLAVGGLVFADSSNGSLNKAVNNGVTKIREKPHWRIQSQRRGRLLPYTYAHTTIGIAKNPVIRILAEGDTAAASDVDIVIINGGSKYGKADTFTLSGASGGGVVLKPVIGEDGAVIGFEVSEVGLVFDASDFLNSDDSLTWETGGSPPSGPVSIVHRDVNQGTGLEAYVLRGEVTTTKLTDKKPEEALESAGPIKLGPDPPLANDAVLQFQQTDPKNQVLKVNPNAKPKNNQYDVFLHYHNDVSHNRIDEASVPAAIEQMIRLQIQTDGASGGGSSLSSNAQGAGSDIDFPPGGGPDQFAGSDWAFNSNNFGGGFMDGIGDFFGGMG
tara:strand:- start:821 stop:5278 length:4458 start_codon:yes stop_codon:yes gene_type:complete